MLQGLKKTNFEPAESFLTCEYFYCKHNSCLIVRMNTTFFPKICYIVSGSLQNMEFL